MMRWLIALLFFPCVAFAQVTPPACLPSTVGGTGTKHVYFESPVGYYAGWHCPKATPVQTVQMWGLWSELAPNWRAQIAEALSTGNLAPGWARMTPCTRAPNGGCFTPAALDDVVRPGWAALQALLPPPPPPPAPEIWRVAPSGTSTTRVVYQIVNGRVGPLTSPLLTVPIGTLCDPAFRALSSGITYMAVPGGAAVCARAAQ